MHCWSLSLLSEAASLNYRRILLTTETTTALVNALVISPFSRIDWCWYTYTCDNSKEFSMLQQDCRLIVRKKTEEVRQHTKYSIQMSLDNLVQKSEKKNDQD